MLKRPSRCHLLRTSKDESRIKHVGGCAPPKSVGLRLARMGVESALATQMGGRYQGELGSQPGGVLVSGLATEYTVDNYNLYENI